MLTIKLHFIRLSEVSLPDIYDQTGVYVLWSGKAKAVPSYIGEGDVLERFNSHARKSWAARPIDGVIALIKTATRRKAYAELAEAALLHVAKIINRYPTHNGNRGKPTAALEKSLRYQDRNIGTIRLVFSGRDPLRAPSNPPMSAKKWIVLRQCTEGWHIDELHWNNRAS
jgi:hypothetical protein